MMYSFLNQVENKIRVLENIRERMYTVQKKYMYYTIYRLGEMTVSVILLQTFNTFSDDVSDLFYILLLGLTWFKVD